MSDSDFEEPPDPRLRPNTPNVSPRRQNAQVARLNRIANRFVQRTNEIVRSPELTSTFSARIASAFRPAHRPVVRRANRSADVLPIRFVCLQAPSQRTTCRLDYRELARFGLGFPDARHLNAKGLCSLNMEWGREEVEQYLLELYPALTTISYELCRSERGGRLTVIPQTDWSARGLQAYFLGGRRRLRNPPTVFIRPNEAITHAPMGTPTLLARVPRDGGDAVAARETIEETRRLRQQQDDAYEESLRVDQERSRRRDSQERTEQMRHQRRQGLERELEQLRADRQSAIQPEPVSGVTIRIRFPDSTSRTRRFSETASIRDLIPVIGCHSDATVDFRVRMPGMIDALTASSLNGTFADNAIRSSLAIDIQWIPDVIESDDESLPLHVSVSDAEVSTAVITQLPHPSITQPPNSSTTQPPHSSTTQPLHSSTTQPPHSSTTQPPHSSATQPPHSSTTQPPHSSATQPPHSSTTQPPHSSTTQPPHSSTTQPPHSSTEVTTQYPIVQSISSSENYHFVSEDNPTIQVRVPRRNLSLSRPGQSNNADRINSQVNTTSRTEQDAMEVMDSEDEELQRALIESLDPSENSVSTNDVALVESDVNTILKAYKEETVNEETVTKLLVLRSKILDTALKGLDRKAINFKARLYIKFSGEMGEDQGGPRREFFRLVMKALQESRFFDGPEDLKIFTHNLSLLDKGHYRLVGRLTAMSLAQDGPGLHFMSPDLYDLMVGKMPQLRDQILLPEDTNSMIQQLRDADTSSKEDTFLSTYGDQLIDIGIPNIYQIARREKATVIEMIIKNHIYYRISGEISQFTSGMNDVNKAWDMVTSHADLFKPIFCFKHEDISVEDMLRLFKVNYSEPGSNNKALEDVTIFGWESFLQSIEDGEIEVSFSEVLGFVTGADHIPPCGFSKLIDVDFYTSEGRLPSVSTCALQLWLPRVIDPDIVSSTMFRALKESYGFMKV